MAITHGTEYRYKKGCRCASCRRAHAEARRKERRAARRKQARAAEISHLHIVVTESTDDQQSTRQETISRHHSASVVDAVTSFTAPMWDAGEDEAEMLILTMLKVAAAIDAGDTSLKPLVDALRSLKRDLKALTDKEDDGGLGDILGGMGQR